MRERLALSLAAPFEGTLLPRGENKSHTTSFQKQRSSAHFKCLVRSRERDFVSGFFSAVFIETII